MLLQVFCVTVVRLKPYIGDDLGVALASYAKLIGMTHPIFKGFPCIETTTRLVTTELVRPVRTSQVCVVRVCVCVVRAPRCEERAPVATSRITTPTSVRRRGVCAARPTDTKQICAMRRADVNETMLRLAACGRTLKRLQ